MIQIIDMALRKTVATAGPYSYNQLITFNIRIFNQGNVPLQNTKINDYIPSGYSYASGDNIGWTGAAPLVSYTYAPVINPGDSALVTINLRVQWQVVFHHGIIMLKFQKLEIIQTRLLM